MPTDAFVMEFFDAIERGKGWDVCRKWCANDATFSCQAKMLDDVKTLADYANWMAAMYDSIPDGHYELKHRASTDDGKTVLVYAVFLGTDTALDGEPKPLAEDYVYAMETEDGKIQHVTKIWNDRNG